MAWVSEWQDAVDAAGGWSQPAEAAKQRWSCMQAFALLDCSFVLTLVFPCPRSPIFGRRIFALCHYILDAFNLFSIRGPHSHETLDF